MERLTQRVKDGILVKESHGENAMKTLYQCFGDKPNENYSNCEEGYCAMEKLADYEDAEEKNSYGKWIPVSERLPEDCVPVNITYVNHNPESYYANIKDVPFTATGICYKGKWYWYSVVCEDYLKEYGERYEVDAVDADIEITAWMPLPEPYRESEEQK